MSGPDEARALFVAAREQVMAHLTEIVTGEAGDASEGMQAWQLAEQTLTLTMAAASITVEAVSGWAAAAGLTADEVLQQLALRVAATH